MLVGCFVWMLGVCVDYWRLCDYCCWTKKSDVYNCVYVGLAPEMGRDTLGALRNNVRAKVMKCNAKY